LDAESSAVMALASPVEYAAPISSGHNHLASFGVPRSKQLGRVKYQNKSKTCQLVRAVSVDHPQLDFSNPDWKKQFQEDFDRRFSLPHLRDVIDVEPRPTTFSLMGR
jgi:6-phosphofructokinase 1